MNKFFTFILGLIISINVFSQTTIENYNNTDKNEVKIGFFQLYEGAFQVGFERYLNNNTSIIIIGTSTIKEKEFNKIIGASGEIQYRFYFYPSENSKISFYTGPYIMYKYREETNLNLNLKSYTYSTDNYTYDNIYGSGIIGGAKFNIFHKIYVDLSLGGGLRLCKSNKSDNYYYEDNGILSPQYSGFAPKLNLMFGLKF